MDYLTKPITRAIIRELSEAFRQIFGVPLNGKFPVLQALEKFSIIFPGSTVLVVGDDELPITTPARCIVNSDGTFNIEIRETIYNGAYQKEIGAFLDHILHEMCHAFLYRIGFTPIANRSFLSGRIKCYCSSEWQAKALCGEIMMPYEETENMLPEEIMEKYSVSYSQAKYRTRY